MQRTRSSPRLEVRLALRSHTPVFRPHRARLRVDENEYSRPTRIHESSETLWSAPGFEDNWIRPGFDGVAFLRFTRLGRC